MNKAASRSPAPYLRIGAIALGLAIPVVVLGLREWFVDFGGYMLLWQIITGATLLGALVYQWRLFLRRLLTPTAPQRTLYNVHRYVGAFTVIAYMAHALSFGYALTSWLSWAFLLSAVTGLLNREVVKYKSQTAYVIWFFAHISTSILLAPLVALHVWVALAYK